MTPPRVVAPTMLSTDGLPRGEALKLWGEMLGRSFARVSLETADAKPFVAQARVLTLPGVAIGFFEAPSHTMTRTKALIADQNNAFLMVIAERGALIFKAGPRQVELGTGGAVVVACAEPHALVMTGECRLIVLAIPATVFAPLLADMDGIVGGVIGADSGALKFVAGYVHTLGDDVLLTNMALRAKVVSHLYEMVALAVSGGRDVRDRGRGRGAAAAKLRTIKADVIEGLSNRDLSVEILAEQRAVSPRWVRRLFEQDGQTFSAFVLEQRLLKAHAILTDPAEGMRPIGQIAFACGFSDLSYFNRVFRRRYGVTPTQARTGVSGRQ